MFKLFSLSTPVAFENDDQNVWQTRQEARMAVPQLSFISESEDANSWGMSNASKRIRLNVGGQHFEVLRRSLRWLPETRLGKLVRAINEEERLSLCDDYESEADEYFFDRDPYIFTFIVGMYRTRKLHFSDEICIINIMDELTYWAVDIDMIEPCCAMKFHHKKDQMDDASRNEEEEEEKQETLEFGTNCYPRQRQYIWDIMEKPQKCLLSRIVAIISIITVLLSTITLTIGTIPEIMTNVTITKNISAPVNTTNESYPLTEVTTCELHENQILESLEVVCIVWFTLEYALRLISCPNKLEFIKGPMNVIDVLAILPYYITQLMFLFHNNSSTMESWNTFKKIMPVFRILRILRVLKLARHSIGLQSLGYTVSNSYKELGLLMMFVILGMLLFSSLIYYAERDTQEEGFSSIPAGFWWAIVTMTTVGYGDVVPKTIVGRIVGSVCSLCGVLVIALPIPIIVNNFADYYKQQLLRQKMLKRKATMIKKASFLSSKTTLSNGMLTEENGKELSLKPAGKRLLNSLTQSCIRKNTSNKDEYSPSKESQIPFTLAASLNRPISPNMDDSPVKRDLQFQLSAPNLYNEHSFSSGERQKISIATSNPSTQHRPLSYDASSKSKHKKGGELTF